jgi:uncharacterized protein YheU (UPF0270 family)
MTDPAAEDENKDYVIVPSEALSRPALEGLIEEFITREGTEYGAREFGLEEKKLSVARLLERGEAVIVFDLEHESTTLMRRQELQERKAARTSA